MVGTMVLNPGQTLELSRCFKKSNAQAPPGPITTEFGVEGQMLVFF